MYKILDEAGNVYTQYTYAKEADFERMIVLQKGTQIRMGDILDLDLPMEGWGLE